MADYIESTILDDSLISAELTSDTTIDSEIDSSITIGGEKSVFIGYLLNNVFYKDAEHTQTLENVQEAIYINLEVSTEDFYRYNGSIFLRTGKESFTKSQADQYYATIEHTHLYSDISNVSMLTQAQMETILNAEE